MYWLLVTVAALIFSILQCLHICVCVQVNCSPCCRNVAYNYHQLVGGTIVGLPRIR